jgi:hypothetical protein
LTLRPFFSYFGSKWRLAKKYPPPAYDSIVEPFAGAAGYATRYADRKVILVEKDPLVAGLWAWLIRARPTDLLSIPLLEIGQTVDDLQVCQEARWLVGFWVARCAARPRKSPGSWMRAGRWARSFWGSEVRSRLAAQVDKIKHWRVINGNYTEAPDIEATWFIDPPYQLMGRHYRFGSKQMDYEALAAWCSKRRGQVTVCEATGADWLPFIHMHTGKGNARNPAGKSHEAVWGGQ